ncbi:hypothetical protein C8R43DRAFT_1119270 [Mycena crocata]|nr:hypothetical protein C8R43DRAFT_1119270 [Mycena crocata]
MPPPQLPVSTAVQLQCMIYDDDEKQLLASRHPVPQANDPCLGRVNVPEIPIPHTIKALIEAICERERLRLMFEPGKHEWAYGTILFKSADAPLAYRKGDQVDLLSDQRPGHTSQDPVILKVWFQEMQEVIPLFGAWHDSGRTEMDTQRNPLYGLSATSKQRHSRNLLDVSLTSFSSSQTRSMQFNPQISSPRRALFPGITMPHPWGLTSQIAPFDYAR